MIPRLPGVSLSGGAGEVAAGPVPLAQPQVDQAAPVPGPGVLGVQVEGPRTGVGGVTPPPGPPPQLRLPAPQVGAPRLQLLQDLNVGHRLGPEPGPLAAVAGLLMPVADLLGTDAETGRVLLAQLVPGAGQLARVYRAHRTQFVQPAARQQLHQLD